MSGEPVADAEWAFRAYEAVRHRLPSPEFQIQTRRVDTLADLTDDFDLFLFDAFGVLNRGDQAVPGAPQRVAQIKAMGKKVMVLSNASRHPKQRLMQHYRALGYDFSPEAVLCSRQGLIDALHKLAPALTGLIAPSDCGLEELTGLQVAILGDEKAIYDRVNRIVFLGVSTWNDDRQALLEASLIANPRPVLVGNPDIVAPRNSGFSLQPGYYAHRLADRTGVKPQFFGKPFGPIFDQALEQVGQGIDRNRILMVGDTLQTDILGGRSAGLKTALVTGFGALQGMNVEDAIAQSGIVPDYIMERP